MTLPDRNAIKILQVTSPTDEHHAIHKISVVAYTNRVIKMQRVK